jgi:hypothetical protein
MKILLITLSLLLIVSCSTSSVSENRPVEHKSTSISDAEKKSYRDNCILNSVALDCARYAYQIKTTDRQAARDFYNKACTLGDKNSCFNLEAMDDGSLETNQNLISTKDDVMYACFEKHLLRITPKGFFSNPFSEDKSEKESKHTLKFTVVLETDGKIKTLDVHGYDSQLEGVKCIRNALETLHFVPNKRTQRLDHSFRVDLVPFK